MVNLKGVLSVALTIMPHATCPSVLLSCTSGLQTVVAFKRKTVKGIGSWILNICLDSLLKCFCFSSHFTKKKAYPSPILNLRSDCHAVQAFWTKSKGQLLFVMDQVLLNMDCLSTSVLSIFG